jgi:hypothetical protein
MAPSHDHHEVALLGDAGHNLAGALACLLRSPLR